MSPKLEKELTEATEIAQILAAVETAADALGAALQRLSALAEPPLMPSYGRAEDQLRIARRAATGAQDVLRRRLQLKRPRGAGDD